MTRFSLLIVAGLMISAPQADAEPVTDPRVWNTFAVTITSIQPIDTSGGVYDVTVTTQNDMAIDPITFLLEVAIRFWLGTFAALIVFAAPSIPGAEPITTTAILSVDSRIQYEREHRDHGTR
jgi:hypothetical protein